MEEEREAGLAKKQLDRALELKQLLADAHDELESEACCVEDNENEWGEFGNLFRPVVTGD